MFTQGHSRTGCLMIDPEADPAQHHDQDAGQISLKNEVSDVPLKLKAQREPLIYPCGQSFFAIVCFVSDYRELWQLCFLDSANWSLFPVHHHVQHGISVWRNYFFEFSLDFIPDIQSAAVGCIFSSLEKIILTCNELYSVNIIISKCIKF